jgi:putative membrane protein
MKTNINILWIGLGMAMVGCSHDAPPRSPQQPIAVSPATKPSPPHFSSANADLGADASTGVAERNREALRDSGTGLTNDQILEVTRTANIEEIQQAHVAHERSKDPRVQKLAAMMMRDEVEAETKGDALANEAALNPDQSSASASLEGASKRETLALKTEGGPEFDRGYVDVQVRAQQALLDLLRDELIPRSTSAGLSAYLHDIKASALTHLQHARDLQQELAGSDRNGTK